LRIFHFIQDGSEHGTSLIWAWGEKVNSMTAFLKYPVWLLEQFDKTLTKMAISGCKTGCP